MTLLVQLGIETLFRSPNSFYFCKSLIFAFKSAQNIFGVFTLMSVSIQFNFTMQTLSCLPIDLRYGKPVVNLHV